SYRAASPPTSRWRSTMIRAPSCRSSTATAGSSRHDPSQLPHHRRDQVGDDVALSLPAPASRRLHEPHQGDVVLLEGRGGGAAGRPCAQGRTTSRVASITPRSPAISTPSAAAASK